MLHGGDDLRSGGDIRQLGGVLVQARFYLSEPSRVGRFMRLQAAPEIGDRALQVLFRRRTDPATPTAGIRQYRHRDSGREDG